MKDKVLAFLKDKTPKLCVLSTTSKTGKPQSAVVGYAVAGDLTLVLSTRRGSRKYTNILDNNQVSIVIGWSFEEPSVQYDGVAEVIEGGEKYAELEDFFFTQNPQAAHFKGPDLIFIKVTPSWIRLTDPSVHPPKVEEEKFTNNQ